MKARHADPVFAEAYSERMRARNTDPEFAKASSKRLKAMNADPEFNRKRARGIAKKPTWPEARFCGLIFGHFNGTARGFHFQEYLPTKHYRRIVDARYGKFIFELDGGGHHAYRDRTKRDRKADAEHAEMGYRVIRAKTANELFLKVLQVVCG